MTPLRCTPMHTSGNMISKGIFFYLFFNAFSSNTDFSVALSVLQRARAQEVKAHPAGSGERAGVAGGGWELLQRWGRRARAHPPARLGLCWSPGDGCFCYLAWFVFAKSLSYWTDLTTFCCVHFYSVILPASALALACVTASEWMSGKRQPDARIKHMGKRKNLIQDSEKGIFKRPFRMIKHRQMWKSALAFVKLKTHIV